MFILAELLARASGGIIRRGFGFIGGDPVKITVVMNRQRLKQHLAAKYSRVLFKTGAFTKTAMQRSMPYRKKPSAPGQPPSAHKPSGRDCGRASGLK